MAQVAQNLLDQQRVSTIVYRDGIMAADSRAYSGSHRAIGRKVKIRRFDDGTLVGVGTAKPGLGEWLLNEWWEGGCPEIAALPIGCADASFTLLAVLKSGEALLADDALVIAGPITAPYFAVGSGGSIALGALFQGGSAVEAATAAATLDPLCGLPIAYISHDQEGVSWA